MKTTTFYSYKGGVGRSLALVNIATRLAEFNKTVCVLDLDLEAPGLHLKFKEFKGKAIQNGIVDYIHDYYSTGYINNDISKYCYEIPGVWAGSIKLIPAGNTQDTDYWRKLSSINWYEMIYESNDGLAFLLDLKAKIENQIKPDFLLIDSRTGISEVSGISTAILADQVVLFAANNDENFDGIDRILNSLNKSKLGLKDKDIDLNFVLCRIPFNTKAEDQAKEKILVNSLKGRFGNYLSDINILHSDRDLEVREIIKIGYNNRTNSQISNDYFNLFEKLFKNDFTVSEREAFSNYKEAELYYRAALTSTEKLDVITYINKAIEINPEKIEYHTFKANALLTYNDFDGVQNILDSVLQKSPDDIFANEIMTVLLIKQKRLDEALRWVEKLEGFLHEKSHLVSILYYKALIYSDQKNYEASNEVYSKIIKEGTLSPKVYNGRANNYRLLKRFDEALTDIYVALEIGKRFPLAYITLAEINAEKNNLNEFYLQFETAININNELDSNHPNKIKDFDFIVRDPIYDRFKNDNRFLSLLSNSDVPIILDNDD